MSETTSEGGKLEATEVARGIDILIEKLRGSRDYSRGEAEEYKDLSLEAFCDGEAVAYDFAMRAAQTLKEKLCKSA